MDSTDQMIVKCASILGLTFPRTMLEHILPSMSDDELDLSLQRLVEEGIFGCATAWHNESGSYTGSIRSKVICECHGARASETQDCAFTCKLLRFQSANMQETAYEMFVEGNRQQLHRAAALYLEGQAHKCQACGGGNFLPSAESKKIPQHSQPSIRPPSAVRIGVKTQQKRQTLEKFIPRRSHALKSRLLGYRYC